MSKNSEEEDKGKKVEVVFLKSASHKPFFLSYGKGQTANVDEKMAVQLSKEGIAIDHKTYLKDQKDDSKKEAGKDADSGKDASKKEVK